MAKKMTFEQANLRIEEIVKILEKGECSLEESMKLYEEGALLLKFCMDELEKCKGKIIDINEKINQNSFDGDSNNE